jgi:hypothetical protein
MKKLFFVALAISGFMAGLVWSQAGEKSFSFNFTIVKGIGDGLFMDKTLDEVWTATTKALVILKYSILQTEKNSGSITAQMTPSKWQASVGLKTGDLRTMNIVIEQRKDGIGIICRCRKGRKKNYEDFYKEIGEILYGVKPK